MQQTTPERRNKPWKTEEESIVLGMVQQGKSYVAIATHVKRTLGAITSRLRELATRFVYEGSTVEQASALTSVSCEDIEEALKMREIADEQRQRKIQNGSHDSKLDDIIKMDGPFTRERLQNIVAEIRKNQQEETIATTADVIKNAIIAVASNRSASVRYVVPHGKTKVVIHFGQIQYHYPNGITEPRPQPSSLLPELIARLKVMFPDSVFQTDPLDTYLIIDWS
jgi:hypothetical protein